MENKTMTAGKNAMKQGFTCCLCNEKSFGWGEKLQYGNNPAPLNNGMGQCCDDCNTTKVIPARLEAVGYKLKSEVSQ